MHEIRHHTRCESAHGREKVDVRVSPDVCHVLAGVWRPAELQLIVLKHRQELESVHPELLEVRDLSRTQAAS
eukprot:scaffold994_cov43-Prasinocladus_malaysianus.AAC.1